MLASTVQGRQIGLGRKETATRASPQYPLRDLRYPQISVSGKFWYFPERCPL